MTYQVEHIGNATLCCGDAFEIFPLLSRGGAIVTDPPYGIGINKSNRLSVSKGHAGETWDEKSRKLTNL